MIFVSRKTYIPLREPTVLDQEAIYDGVIGVLVSNRDLDLPDVLSTELAAYPPSIMTDLYKDYYTIIQMVTCGCK